MRRQLWVFRWTVLVVLAGWAAAALLGAAASNFFAVSQMLVLGALGAPLVAAVYAWPPLGLLCGVTFPLLGNALGNSLVLPGGLLLVGVGAVRSWPDSSLRSRRAAGFILLLGSLTVLIGIVLAQNAGPSRGQGLAVVYATAVGMAAALGAQGFAVIGACLWSAALPMAVIAYGSPALRIDRTMAVLGENANGVGTVSALGFVAAVAMVRSAPLYLRVVALPVAVVCLAGVLVSGSRGALAVVLAGGVTALVWSTSARAGGRRIVGLVVAAGIAFLYTEPLFDRFLVFAGRSVLVGDPALDSRLSLLPFALEQGLSHPLRGVGLGQLGTVGASFAGYRVDQRAHNVYVGAFAETGIIISVLLIIVSALALRRAWAWARVTGLPLAVAAVMVGMSLEWWGSGVVGPVVMLVIGACLGVSGPSPTLVERDDATQSVGTRTHGLGPCQLADEPPG